MDKNGSHLDMALNAMLVLAEIANRQSDATGFISFSADNDVIASPKKGAGVINYLLNQSVDLQPSMRVSDYMLVARRALAIQKRRSLIILLTNIRSDYIDDLVEAVKLLMYKHRVIVVNLYEEDLKWCLNEVPQTLDETLKWQSIGIYLAQQKVTNGRIADETGAMVISSTPRSLPQKLLEGYLRVKRFGTI